MTVRVVLRHEHPHLGARLLGAARVVTGGLLLGAGVLVGPFGLFFLAGYAAQVISQVTGDAVPGEPGVFDDVPYPTSTVVLLAGAATLLLVLGLTVGLRLLRSGRTVVLFLRRFRDAEAIGALSAAAAGAVGSSWRVVTLDDGRITPLGAAAGTRRLLAGLKGLYAVVVTLATRVIPVGAGLFAAAAAVVAVKYLVTGTWDLDLVTRTLPGDDAFLGAVPPPPQPLGPDVETLFYLLVAAAIVCIGVGMAGFVLMLALFPLAGPAMLAAVSSGAVEAAQTSRRAAVRSGEDLARATSAVVSGSRRVLAPRLVVLQVDDGWWRQSVEAFADVAAATVVDVSEPSENVLWEVERLRAARTRLVAVGHVPELGGLDTGPLAAVLDGEEVLGYTLTWWGRRRFTRALRSTLLCG